MRRDFVIVFLLSFLLAGQLNAAHVFKSASLKKAAEILGIVDGLDSVALGHTLMITAKDGQAIEVRKSNNDVIDHIGIPLFKGQMRMLMPSPVYDFLEYAVLNRKYNLQSNTLNLSKVLFRKGSWETLINSRLEECSCIIENVEERLYVVTWQKDSLDVVVIGIPIEYELLSNDSRRNLEKNFIEQLNRYIPAGLIKRSQNVKEDDLKIYGTEGLFVIQGDSHIISELNQNEYYTLKTVYQYVDTIMFNRQTTLTLEDVVPVLVIDKEHPNETFANLVISRDLEAPDPVVNLDFHLSNYHRSQLTISLSKLKEFCLQQGSKLYFASSGVVRETELLRGVLFVHNPAKGYNHLFSLSIPLDKLEDANPEMSAAAYLYIPPIDKSHLFGPPPTKKSGAKIIQHL